MTRPQTSPPITPLGGWFLDHIVALDSATPGLAGHVMRASSERRQILAAYLSRPQPHSDFRSDAETGWFLMHGTHDCILKAAFGSLPMGLRGALRRSGEKVHRPRYYRYLHLLLTLGDRQTVTALQRMQSITMAKLRILRALPERLRLESLIDNLRSIEQARDVVALVTLLERHGVDVGAMADALSKIEGPKAIQGFATRWVQKLTFPAHPAPAGEGYRPILQCAELYSLALLYRNCLRTQVAAVMKNRSSFAEVTHPDGSGIAHLAKINGEWVLEHVWGRDNRPPPAAVDALATSHLRSHGILERERWMDQNHIWGPLRRLTHVHDFGEDQDD